LKPFYRIAKARIYWWTTYSNYHKEKLLIATSIYNLCFLITTNKDIFGIISIQTDNIIILVDKRFSAREEEELKQTKYITKPKEKLIIINLLLFNSCVFLFQGDQITFCQKD
jgi:hypothetical protein